MNNNERNMLYRKRAAKKLKYLNYRSPKQIVLDANCLTPDSKLCKWNESVGSLFFTVTHQYTWVILGLCWPFLHPSDIRRVRSITSYAVSLLPEHLPLCIPTGVTDNKLKLFWKAWGRLAMTFVRQRRTSFKNILGPLNALRNQDHMDSFVRNLSARNSYFDYVHCCDMQEMAWALLWATIWFILSVPDDNGKYCHIKHSKTEYF